MMSPPKHLISRVDKVMFDGVMVEVTVIETGAPWSIMMMFGPPTFRFDVVPLVCTSPFRSLIWSPPDRSAAIELNRIGPVIASGVFGATPRESIKPSVPPTFIWLRAGEISFVKVATFARFIPAVLTEKLPVPVVVA